jgi:lysozyme
MIKLPINQNQFDSFCSLAFNIGQTAFANSSALAMFNEGFTDLVPAKIALWCKITDPTTGEKIIDAGLVRRRSAEIVLYNTPA